MTSRIDQLRLQGQSVWLDYIRRGLLASGGLTRLVRDGIVQGVTSNPTIFQRAIAGSDDYASAISALAADGISDAYAAFVRLGSEDIRIAADVLRPVYEGTAGADGFVSFEVQDADTDTMVREAHSLFESVGRPNVMIKIPGTQQGIGAVERLIAGGVNVNTTLLFSVAVYEQAANAYIAGLEKRLAQGLAVDRIAAVASFFVSRIDTKVDSMLAEGSPLRGKVAVASARRVYQRFGEIFSGPRWQRLAEAGARVQRPLWASTGTKNPAYSDVLYVDELVAPHTVNTMPEATLDAYLDHGRADCRVEDWPAEADAVLSRSAAAGINMQAVTDALLEEGLVQFRSDFQKLLQELTGKLAQATPSSYALGGLGELAPAVERRLQQLSREDVVGRIWREDHHVWSDDPTEITSPNRLAWLRLPETMQEQVADLQAFAAEVAAEDFRSALVLGMGGSSLTPAVFSQTTRPGPAGLALSVLDSTDPETIRAMQQSLDLDRTLFIVASKSGTTVETLSHFAYFWSLRPNGRRFVAITDTGTSLETLARERGFRRVFINPSDLGGRYSALSLFGLVPAALLGVDIEALLASARELADACRPYVPPRDNPGALLGATLGEAALARRDKLTLLLDEQIAPLGAWVEQLIAESTGKLGRGILPVDGEPLARSYGDDRLFVRLGAAAREVPSSQPALSLHGAAVARLGAEFFRWEFATAVAGHVLGINPFDQPDVEAAKQAARKALSENGAQASTATTPSLAGLRELVRPGDYIAVQAYLPRLPHVQAALQELRSRLLDGFGVATTIGFGPRYLHSTGQLHKGGPETGVYLQLIGGAGPDIDVPGESFSFARLKRAQANGDAAALQARGRRLLRFDLGADYLAGIQALTASL